MPKRAKTMTIIVSGDYHGPQDRSTGALSWEPMYSVVSGQTFKMLPRSFLSVTSLGESDFFLFLNKRLGGEYDASELVTLASDPGASSSGAEVASSSGGQQEGLHEEA